MKIVVVGAGYVGLVTAACLAEIGSNVVCIDIDQDKIDRIKQGIMPIYEPGVEDVVMRNLHSGRLSFSTSIPESLPGAHAVFIAVGTPQGEDGSADLQYVLAVADEIGDHLNDYTVVVTKSTVPVGTSDKVRARIQDALDRRQVSVTFDIASNPEFLKEGVAVKDFMKPDRIVIGTDSERAKDTLGLLYQPFMLNGHPILFMDIRSAELTKYAANTMLATRISFMNDIANLCELLGADINEVRKGIATDPRIGDRFLYSGVGYGGSCFPKDVQALIRTAQELDYEFEILEAVDAVNNRQKFRLYQKIYSYFNGQLKGKKIAVWGLSFKPNTDDIREAPALVIIEELLAEGAEVKAFDPAAMGNVQALLGDKIAYGKDIYDTAIGADAIVLVTEWNEFRLPDWDRIHQDASGYVVFDGRNIYKKALLKSKGFDYFGIGR